MNLRATQPHDSAPAPAAGARFAYASGSRPLEGYTIKRGIGHGGFGEVYYAVSDAGKEVALKLVRRNLDIELRGVTQCLNLKHPNLLALYDIRQDDHDETWVVMEYVNGQCLEDVMAANPQGLPPAELLGWMHGIAAGVAYLHDHGIVHRDLKPGNIFCEEGVVKIGDYGLSKFISCSRRSGQTGSVGTVHYMAPEVANGRYGKEIDIYALGIMLYEMITGHVPFEGESLGEVLMKHLTAQADLSMIAEPYRTAILRSLAKDPDHRLHTVGELMAMLPRPAGDALGSNHPVQLQPAVTPGRALPGGTGFASYPPRPGAEPPDAGDASGFASFPPPNANGNRAPSSLPSPLVGEGPGVRGNANDPVRADAIDGRGKEEPLLRLVRTAWNDLRGWWVRANLPAWQRLLILLAAAFVLLTSVEVWMPIMVMSGIAYAIYFVVWSLVAKNSAQPTNARPIVAQQAATPPPQANPVAAGPYVGNGAYASPTLQRWRHSDPPVALLPIRSRRERVTELVGSLFVGGVVALLIALVMMALRSTSHGNLTEEMNQYAWLALSAIAGTWGILIVNKLWEGRRIEPALRRFTMLAIGLGLGAAAYGLQSSLLVPIHAVASTNLHQLPNLYDPDGTPTVYAYLIYFGFLLLVPRWWRQTERLRTTRLSLWAVAVSVFWAAVANFIWAFPPPWGLMLAATVSIAVQLASPCVRDDQRQTRNAA